MVHRLGLILYAVCLAWVTPRAGQAADSKPEGFHGQIKPFLAKYCTDCHGGAEPEKNLARDKLPDSKQPDANDREMWSKVRKYLHGRIMPPKDSAQPTADEFR